MRFLLGRLGLCHTVIRSYPRMGIGRDGRMAMKSGKMWTVASERSAKGGETGLCPFSEKSGGDGGGM